MERRPDDSVFDSTDNHHADDPQMDEPSTPLAGHSDGAAAAAVDAVEIELEGLGLPPLGSISGRNGSRLAESGVERLYRTLQA